MAKPQTPENVAADLMRWIDAYAADYAKDGKLAKSRRKVQKIVDGLTNKLAEVQQAAAADADDADRFRKYAREHVTEDYGDGTVWRSDVRCDLRGETFEEAIDNAFRKKEQQ